MNESLTSSVFPDINVWIALSSTRHIHHLKSVEWLRGQHNPGLAFCRYTQLGFLRPLTTEAVMGRDTLTPIQAWEEYDKWLKTELAVLLEEPLQLEQSFRSFARESRSSPKEWAESYRAAFSVASGTRLVTFDQGLKSRLKDAILLRQG